MCPSPLPISSTSRAHLRPCAVGCLAALPEPKKSFTSLIGRPSQRRALRSGTVARGLQSGCRRSKVRSWSAHFLFIALKCGRSRTNKSTWSRASLHKPSLPLRTRGCSTSCTNRCSSRRPLPRCCASSIVRRASLDPSLAPYWRTRREFAKPILAYFSVSTMTLSKQLPCSAYRQHSPSCCRLGHLLQTREVALVVWRGRNRWFTSSMLGRSTRSGSSETPISPLPPNLAALEHFSLSRCLTRIDLSARSPSTDKKFDHLVRSKSSWSLISRIRP